MTDSVNEAAFREMRFLDIFGWNIRGFNHKSSLGYETEPPAPTWSSENVAPTKQRCSHTLPRTVLTFISRLAPISYAVRRIFRFPFPPGQRSFFRPLRSRLRGETG